jgi:mannose-6-phosphate isomerase-like protein (cupin superfamily)
MLCFVFQRVAARGSDVRNIDENTPPNHDARVNATLHCSGTSDSMATNPVSEPRQPDKYMLDPYLDWARGEGVPIHEDFAVDLLTIETGPWARLEARGAIANLKGRGDFTSIFLIELPADGKTAPQKHLYEEVIYVVSGHGSTTVTAPDGRTHSFEWGPKSLFAVPLNARHQHFNGSGSAPARLASTNSLSAVLNLFHDVDFVFDNPCAFPARMGKTSYFSGEGDFLPYKPGRHIWETNFIPDLSAIELKAWDARGAGSTNMMFMLADGTIGAHSSEIPVGSYKKGHRHDAGRHVYAVTGSGYTLAWYEGDKDFLRIPWHHGIVYAPPDRMFHQHFNTSPQRARYLAVGIGSRRYPFLTTKRHADREVDLSIKEGGRQIEYADQDPRIHPLYLRELAANGVECRMTEFAST